MPHFIIDCSKQIIELKSPEDIMRKVYDAADLTRLFLPEEIKVRINPFQYYNMVLLHLLGHLVKGNIEKSLTW